MTSRHLHFSVVVPVALVLSLAATRADAQSVGLRDVLAQAVKGNPQLQGRAVDVAIATAQIRETYGLDDWLIDAGVDWSSSRTDAVPGSPFQITAADSVTGSAGVTKPLPYGGRIGLRLQQDWSRQESLITVNGMSSTDTANSYEPTVQLVYFQPILRGFGSQVRNADRTRARGVLAVSTLQAEGTASTVIRDVIQAYWELAYAARDLDIKRQSLALAQEQLRVTNAQIEVGRLPRSDSLPVEQAVATREEEVFLAEQTVSERSIELRRLTGMEIARGQIHLVATDTLETAGKEPDLDHALEAAMQANPELALVRQQGANATIEVELSENGLLPQLDFEASAGPSGKSDNFGDAYSQLGQFETYGVRAGLTFSLPVGNTAAKARRDVARLQVKKARLNEADVKAQIAAQTVRAVNLVRSARKRMEVAARASALAEKNVELETARWQAGKATQFNVLERQDELAQARLREARARADYLSAVATLEALTGELLGRYGIAVPGASK